MKTGKILFQMVVFALIITSSCAPPPIPHDADA
jgi:hypothetical protein